MKTRYRVGSAVPCENVDPHTGSFLDYGIIEYWIDRDGHKCQRKDAIGAMVEATGRRFADWSEWAEQHAFRLDPFMGKE